MSRCGVHWKRNPHRALLQFSTDIPKSRHLDTPRSISRDRQGLWKPRIRVARLLFSTAAAFSTCTRNLSLFFSLSLSLSLSLFRASAFQPPFQVAPALKYRARRSWISGAGVSAAKLSCCLVTKSRELPRILRAAIRSFVRAFHFVQLRATKSDVYRTPAYARLQLVSIDSTGTRHEPKLVSDNSL